MKFRENIQEEELPEELSSFDRVIYTDHNITKYHIWLAYEGLKEFYINWDMNRVRGQEKPYLRYGLFKYIKEFIIQIKCFLDDKKIKDKVKGSDRALSILKKVCSDKPELSNEEIHFIRFFAEDFLSASGMKNISRNVSLIPSWLRG